VSRFHDFPETKFLHFLSSSVALYEPMRMLATAPEYTLGEGALDSVMASHAAQKGGNTHLGTILLFVPLAKAASSIEGDITPDKLRTAIIKVLDDASFEDSVNVYNAINFAPVGGLNPVPQLDVREASTLESIKERKIGLRQWMSVGSSVNTVAFEYENYFKLTFDTAVPTLKANMEKDVERAVVHTFITLLATREDGHITGQFGAGTAQDMVEEAKAILEAGSVWERKGQELIDGLGNRLREKGVNPGSTADLTATALFVALMSGLTF
jgi:triphosphoribosyl-dephospho-CoA synthase